MLEFDAYITVDVSCSECGHTWSCSDVDGPSCDDAIERVRASAECQFCASKKHKQGEAA